MSRAPDFFDLVGDEGTPEELEQLRRAHDLLARGRPAARALAASRRGAGGRARRAAARRRAAGDGAAFAARSRRRRCRLRDRLPGRRPRLERLPGDRGTPIAMHPPASAGAARRRASILIGDRDEVGNWPLLVHVSGLKPLPKGEWYELCLTRKGKPVAWCGAFRVEGRRPDDRALLGPVQAARASTAGSSPSSKPAGEAAGAADDLRRPTARRGRSPRTPRA